MSGNEAKWSFAIVLKWNSVIRYLEAWIAVLVYTSSEPAAVGPK